MAYIIVAIIVLIGAILTFFSGFGLGTLLLPVFSLFFPLAIAVTAQALVHFSNNVFKFGMVYKHIHYPTLIRFGMPALIAAFGGAYLMTFFGTIPTLHSYTIGSHTAEMTYLKLVIGFLMIFFAWFELDKRFSDWKVEKKYLPIGGLLSGFFGGLSGHQGAFRAAFLAKSGLSKEQFIGTSNAVSLIVDSVRITTYLTIPTTLIAKGGKSFSETLGEGKLLLIIGVVFAFLGTYFGKKLVQKTTITRIQQIVGIMLIIMGMSLITGVM